MGVTKKRHGFTFFELIVAVAVVSLILPTVFTIIFIMIRQQLVLYGYREIKKQGDSVYSNIQQLITENGIMVTDSNYTYKEICPIYPTPSITMGSDLYLLDTQMNGITITGNTQIASISASTNITTYLTSNDVTISGLTFTCYKTNAYSPSVITVSYAVNKNVLQHTISLQYRFKAQLRPYSY